MNNRFWTNREEYLLGLWYSNRSLKEISRRLKRTPAAIKVRAALLKLSRRNFWTIQDRKRLKKYYLNHTGEQCAAKLERSLSGIYGQVNKYGFQHSKQFNEKLQKMFARLITEAGKPYRYQEGHQGAYKFPKGHHASRATEFKKGHQPAGTLYNGAIRIRLAKTGHCGHKRLMRFIRIKKNKWIYLKNHIWEKHHGKVPKGMLVAFRNPKDTMNCSIRNLCLITKAQSAMRTQQTDEYFAMMLAHKGGFRGNYDRELYNEVLKQPSLLRLKRKEIQLRRKLKANGKTSRK